MEEAATFYIFCQHFFNLSHETVPLNTPKSLLSFAAGTVAELVSSWVRVSKIFVK
jgi:hypothetical protein